MQTVIELEREASDGLELLELAEGDEDMLADVAATLRRAAEKAEKAELEALLSGEVDGNDCYMNINAGAGLLPFFYKRMQSPSFIYFVMNSSSRFWITLYRDITSKK